MAQNRISVVISVVTDRASKGLKDFKTAVADADGAFGKLKAGGASAMAALKANAAVVGPAIGLALLKGSQVAIDAASDLEESANAMRVTFGDAADGIAELGEDSVESFGLSERAFNEAAVSFSSFAEKIAGEGGDVVSTMDEMLTRAADFASVHNLELSDATTKFQSALAGETEAVRRFGVDVSAATVTAYAYANGIAEQGEKLTETEKIQARYGVLLQDTAKWAGDWENTSDGLAGSQKKLSANLEDVTAAVGERLIPAAIVLAEELNDVVGSMEDIGAVTADIPGMAEAFKTWGDYLKAIINPLGWIVDKVQGLFGVNEPVDDLADSTLRLAGKMGQAAEAQRAAGAAAAYLEGELDTSATTIEAITDLTEEQQAEIEATAKKWEEWGEGVSDAAATAQENYDEMMSAASDWAQGWRDDVDSAAESFLDLEITSETSANKWVEDRAKGIAAAQEFETAMGTLTKTLDEEFVAQGTMSEDARDLFVADMLAAGQGSVGVIDGLNENEGLLADAVAGYETQATELKDGMLDEYDLVGPGMADRTEQARLELVRDLQLMKVDAAAKAALIGGSIPTGMSSGIRNGQGGLNATVRNMVDQALAAASDQLDEASPSKEFAKLGVTIPQGLAAGIFEEADQVTDAIVDTINDAKDAGIDAADDLVESMQDHLGGAWDFVDDNDAAEKIQGDIADAQADIDEARQEQAVAATIEDPEERAEAIAKAIEKETKAAKDLEDANLAYAKSVQWWIGRSPEITQQWRDLATAGGLTADEIFRVVRANKELAESEEDADRIRRAAAQTAGTATSVAGAYQSLVDQGLIDDEHLEMVGDLKGGAQFDKMAEIVMRMMPGFTAAPAGSITINVTAGMGADGASIGQSIVEQIRNFERVNGTGWRSL